MRAHTTRTTLFVFACFCGAMLGEAPRAAADEEQIRIGDAMPALSLPRADRATGEFDLKLLAGKPAVVVFWRPEQRLSLDALLDLAALQEQLGGNRIAVLGVDSGQSSAEEVQAALAGEALPFPTVLDPERALYAGLGVIVSPTTFVLDADGTARFKMPSHPRQYRQVIGARLRFLLGDIDEEQMNHEIEPTVLKIDHNLAAAWRMYNLGKKLEAEGKHIEAAALYEKAAAQYPSLPEARCALGMMRLAQGQLDEAAEQFRAALTFQPDAPLARLGQAAVLARTGHADRAEEILLSLLAEGSSAVRVSYELGRIYRARGEDDKAVVFYEEALKATFPDSTPKKKAVVERPPTRMPEKAPAPMPVAHADPPSAVLSQAQAIGTIQAIRPPADAQYVGVKACKKCHFQQWKSWKDTKMARAIELLGPGERIDAKVARGLEPEKDYRSDTSCLQCHTTGFGFAGGYEVGDAISSNSIVGVQCEMCHGPGQTFIPIHKNIQDNEREYHQSELYAAGQYELSVRVCAACHSGQAPCIGDVYEFDFEQRKAQGTHQHYDLKFRAK